MTKTDPRTAGFLRAYHSYKLRYTGDSELQLLRRMDARILPCFATTIEHPPLSPLTTKTLLNGLVDFVTAMDNRLAELGHAEFVEHSRIVGAKNFFGREGIDVEDVMKPMVELDNQSPMQAFIAVRKSLWDQIPT
jgi:hypothetical protein